MLDELGADAAAIPVTIKEGHDCGLGTRVKPDSQAHRAGLPPGHPSNLTLCFLFASFAVYYSVARKRSPYWFS